MDAVDAEGELVERRLADQPRPGVEEGAHRRRGGARGAVRAQPFRAAGASDEALDVEKILGGEGEAVEQATRPADDDEVAVAAEGAEVVRHGIEGRAGSGTRGSSGVRLALGLGALEGVEPHAVVEDLHRRRIRIEPALVALGVEHLRH